MLSSLRTRTSNAVRVLGRVRRYSTPIESIPKADETPGAPRALRPHLNIPVNPNHGLYAFFRKREKDGKVTHDPLEDDAGLRDTFGESPAPYRSFPSYGQPFLTVVGWLFPPGRAWNAAELRRKSFRDLHTLWYVLLRERNLIATQMESYRRADVARGVVGNVEKRAFQVRPGTILFFFTCADFILFFSLKCRKGMARIKYVINERRLAYEGAMKIHAEKLEQAAKEERGNSAEPIHQEREAQKVSPPVSEATQAAVDSLLQRSTT